MSFVPGSSAEFAINNENPSIPPPIRAHNRRDGGLCLVAQTCRYSISPVDDHPACAKPEVCCRAAASLRGFTSTTPAQGHPFPSRPIGHHNHQGRMARPWRRGDGGEHREGHESTCRLHLRQYESPGQPVSAQEQGGRFGRRWNVCNAHAAVPAGGMRPKGLGSVFASQACASAFHTSCSHASQTKTRHGCQSRRC